MKYGQSRLSEYVWSRMDKIQCLTVFTHGLPFICPFLMHAWPHVIVIYRDTCCVLNVLITTFCPLDFRESPRTVPFVFVFFFLQIWSAVTTQMLRGFFGKTFPLPPLGSKHIFLTHVSPQNKSSQLPAGWCQLFWLDRPAKVEGTSIWDLSELVGRQQRCSHTTLTPKHTPSHPPLHSSPLHVNSTVLEGFIREDGQNGQHWLTSIVYIR